MKILTVIGNRPQFIKAAAVSPRLRETGTEILVHTGQHFDDELSRVFFAELGLPEPDRQLHVAGGSNTSQLSRMLDALEPVLEDLDPDAVLVYGDTNSTLAGGLAAAQRGVAVAHVEAGMRSFDRTMPEELNRVLTDHLSSLLLCSSAQAVDNLRGEGVAGELACVGDVMVDVAARIQPRARQMQDVLGARGLRAGEYLLVTAHRAGNVDPPERLERLVELLLSLPAPAILPLHPRTRSRLVQDGLLERLANAPRLKLTAPLGYVETMALLTNASALLTDSGGLQKEAYLARIPCLTLRPNTEWVETVQSGWNQLVDLDPAAVAGALEAPPPSEHPPLYGDGRAGERVVEALRSRFGGG
ncbi:MAG TPA: UDP-N-acetylglucosamine 2-epimerase (non-hydrolyzing) [Solirubrobacteraceae bacterium]|nr:UDP-N-acetylglucosamine 2-epimerase (non-hydrolyzing) [Solirubrobacteraceae bacterium]